MGKFKERINYMVDYSDPNDIVYVGYPVNTRSVTVQAHSIDELKVKMKKFILVALNHMRETIEQDEPFELKEFHNIQEWLEGVDELDKIKIKSMSKTQDKTDELIQKFKKGKE